MARPEDVHVLTLIERLFVHNILKNKKIQEQIILKKKITFVKLPTSEHALAFGQVRTEARMRIK